MTLEHLGRPPRRQLLTPVCAFSRMGSFSSAPRVVNTDCQDDDVHVDLRAREDVCRWCERQLQATNTPAKLLSRRMVAVEGLPSPHWGTGRCQDLPCAYTLWCNPARVYARANLGACFDDP